MVGYSSKVSIEIYFILNKEKSNLSKHEMKKNAFNKKKIKRLLYFTHKLVLIDSTR